MSDTEHKRQPMPESLLKSVARLMGVRHELVQREFLCNLPGWHPWRVVLLCVICKGGQSADFFLSPSLVTQVTASPPAA